MRARYGVAVVSLIFDIRFAAVIAVVSCSGGGVFYFDKCTEDHGKLDRVITALDCTCTFFQHFLDGRPTRHNPNPIPALSNRKHLQEKRKSSEATPPPSKYRKCLDTASSAAAAGNEQTDQTSKPDRPSGQEIYPYDEGTQSHTSETDEQPDAADKPMDSSLQKRSAKKSPRKKRVNISSPAKVSPLRTLLNEPKLIDAPLLQPLPEKPPMKLTENELSPAEILIKEEAPMDLSLKRTLKKATPTDSPSEISSSFKRTAQTGKSSRLRKTSSNNCSSVEISSVHVSLNDVAPIDLSMKTVLKKTTTPIKIKLKRKILGRKKEIKSKNKVSCPHCHRCFSPTAEERTRIAAGSTSIRHRSGTKVSDRCLIDVDLTDARRRRGRRLDWDTKLGSVVSWESRLVQHSTDVPPLALPASRSPSPGRPAHHMPHSVPVAVSKSTSALSADNLPCPGRSKDAPTTTDRGDRSHTALCTTPPPETNAAVQPSCAPDQPNPQQALNPGTLDTMAEDASGKRVVLVAIDASKQAEDAVRCEYPDALGTGPLVTNQC